MAKNFTLTCPRQLLERVLPDFDVMGGNLSWVTLKTKQALDGWLNSGQSPEALPEISVTGEPVRMMLSFGGASEMMLRTLAKQNSLTESEAARRIVGLLANAGLADQQEAVPVAAEDFVEILRLASYREVRPEQISFYLQNKASLNGGKIGLSEAATGTGKTVSMLVVAAEMANASQARVVITCPTISLLHQFKRTYEAVPVGGLSLQEAIKSRLGTAPVLRSIYGRREFVSEVELSKLIASGALEPALATAAQVWLDHTLSLPQTNPDIWLTAALDAALVDLDFPMDEVRLPEMVVTYDHGYLAYTLQKEYEVPHEAEIVLVTHAMLGIDFRARLTKARRDEEYQEISELVDITFKEFIADARESREQRHDSEATGGTNERVAHSKSLVQHYESERGRVLVRISEECGIIPPYRYLLVDECHQFETSLSRVLSNYVALRQVERELEEFASLGGKVTKVAIRQARYAMQDILASGPSPDTESRDGDIIILNSTTEQARHPELLPAIATLANILSSIKLPAKDCPPEAARLYIVLRRDMYVLKAVANGAYGMLSYSPIRKFPQLTVGRPSLEAMLKQLWSFVEGASCVSATIYLPKGDSQTGWYMKSILAIPDHREAEYAPSAGAWIFRPVREVWQPETEDVAARLTPPKVKHPDYEELNAEWHNAIAETIIQRIASDAKGGILVLCTSYATCEAVGKLLGYALPLHCIIAAHSKLSLAAQKAAFLKARSQDIPTIWLATGGAWTGLDISGKDIGQAAEDDNLLTDLVIPRLPFNTNRSITHQHRKLYRPSISWEIFETCFAFRQALGRLVRRVGIPANRRIWVLDGRMTGPDKARLGAFQKVLDKYR